jgi:hypothetical protein
VSEIHDDDKFDAIIDRDAKGYRAGNQPPADRMWSRIQQDVAAALREPRQPRSIARQLPWLVAGVGIAAALVLGVAIGRRSTKSIMPVASFATVPDSVRDQLMRAVTLNHFAQAEVFLTEVRADLKTGRTDPQRSERSRLLLARTRLLLANDTTSAPKVELLLQDLELVLAEIAALPDSNMRRSIQTQLLDERLRVGTVLPRIRTILPTPPGMGGS